MARDPANPALSSGMRVFSTIWLGQTVSLVGSGLTDFALGVWVYERTGSATKFALISFFTVLPTLLVTPLAGTLVDRWDRRRAMLLSDTGAALSILAIALLLLLGRLQVWHIFVGVAANAAFSALQWLAYSATVSVLVPNQQLGRAGGMRQLGEALGQITSPVLGAFLLSVLGLGGVIFIDLLTFLLAVLTLLIVRVSTPARTKVAERTKATYGSLLRDATYGWTYLSARPGLMALLIFFALNNFLVGMIVVLGPPFVLSLASSMALGRVMSIGGGGMLLGGLVMSLWGGPKRRIYGVLGFELLGGLSILIAGLHPSVTVFAVLGAIFFFRLPIVKGSRDAIWQSNIAPEVQGRVFSAQRILASSTYPLAFLVAGRLADRVFEPLMTTDGPLAGSIGLVIGVGPGRGISLLFAVVGMLTILATAGAYLYTPLRLVERLPDSQDKLAAAS